jgi:hypothetical protein
MVSMALGVPCNLCWQVLGSSTPFFLNAIAKFLDFNSCLFKATKAYIL